MQLIAPSYTLLSRSSQISSSQFFSCFDRDQLGTNLCHAFLAWTGCYIEQQSTIEFHKDKEWLLAYHGMKCPFQSWEYNVVQRWDSWTLGPSKRWMNKKIPTTQHESQPETACPTGQYLDLKAHLSFGVSVVTPTNAHTQMHVARSVHSPEGVLVAVDS